MNNEEATNEKIKYVENLHQATAYYKRIWNVVSVTDQYTILRQKEGALVRLLPCPKHLTHILKECPCKRCHKYFPDHEIKYDDDYLQEGVCRNCANNRNCEICYKKCRVKNLTLNQNNYMVCSMCNEHEMSRCDNCRQPFYAFKLNYVPRNAYFCDACEDVHNEEYNTTEYDEY